MTRRGNYTVELVDAGTKQKFKEHKARHGFHAYIEVEPDAEYFIRFIHHAERNIIVTYKVDGQKLGYELHCIPEDVNKELDHGLWSRNNNHSHDKALKFQKVDPLSLTRGEKAVDDTNDTNAAVIEINIYERIFLDGYDQAKNEKMINLIDSVNVDETHFKPKKLLKSAEGQRVKTSFDSTRIQNAKCGRKLKTIKVKYCSVVGLIEAGVLPKPKSIYDYGKLIKPSITSTKKLDIKAEVFTHESRDENGTIIESSQVEMFDLTKVMSSS